VLAPLSDKVIVRPAQHVLEARQLVVRNDTARSVTNIQDAGGSRRSHPLHNTHASGAFAHLMQVPSRPARAVRPLRCTYLPPGGN
jgi:hypothetical protein